MLEKYFKEYTCFQNDLREAQMNFFENFGILIDLHKSPISILSKNSKNITSFSSLCFSHYIQHTESLLVGDYKYFTKKDILAIDFLDENFNTLHSIEIANPNKNEFTNIPNNNYRFIKCRLIKTNKLRGFIDYNSCWINICNQINPHIKSYNQKHPSIYNNFFKKILLKRLKLWGKDEIPEKISQAWVIDIYSLDWLYELGHSFRFLFNCSNRELLISTYIDASLMKAETNYILKHLKQFTDTNSPYIINNFKYKRTYLFFIKKYLQIKLLFCKKPFKLSV